MKEVIKNKTKKIWIIILIILLPIFIYLLIDWKNLYVDMYNFRQLEKTKTILDSIPKDVKNYPTLREYNENYNLNLIPIKNCYYVNFKNWKYPYIFWFKLESYIYIYIYKTKFFSYPDYDLQVKLAWPLFSTKPLPDDYNPDSTRRIFENVISNPCRD